MGAPKGYRGETCAEALQSSLKPGELVGFSELFARVRNLGAWKDEAIWQHLMSCVVNLPPARRHWRSTRPFLLIHLDGRYELHDRSRHPQVVE
jgi:hypothetical protein